MINNIIKILFFRMIIFFNSLGFLKMSFQINDFMQKKIKSNVLLFFIKYDQHKWIEASFEEIQNNKNIIFFIIVDIYFFHIKNLYIKQNNNAIKLVTLYHDLSEINYFIDYFYLDVGLKWLFDTEYQELFPEYTILFPKPTPSLLMIECKDFP